MKASCYFLVVLCLLGFSLTSISQERPPINVFTPESYGAGSQNWGIAQSKDRSIYVANNMGLLEYNGSKWTLYESPNQTILRSVKVVDSLIYTGSYHDFGFWKRDDYGVLNYTSLANQLGIEFQEDEEFWNIESLDNWILFQSFEHIYIYNKQSKSHSAIRSKTEISKLFKVGDNFYFQNRLNGLYRIENGTDVLVSNDTIVTKNLLVEVFAYSGGLILLTQNNGFYILDEGGLGPWRPKVNEGLQDVSVFSCTRLRDGSFILGTISHGIIHIDENGEEKYRIAQSNGLSNNTVLSLFEDMDNNLWLGLDNGVNCINMKSPYRIFLDKTGIIGSVYTSLVYQDMLYLGTNQGLFCRPFKGGSDFKFIEGTQGQVWYLGIINNTLFCGHNSGTFSIEGKKATEVANVQGTWLIKPVEGSQDLLLQGNYNGLYVLRNNNGKWQFRNKTAGFNISSRYFEFLSDTEVFVSHEYKGVYKLRLDKDLTKVLSVDKKEIVENKLYSSLIKYDDNILYSSMDGVFKYNSNTKQFEQDSVLSGLISRGGFTSAKLVPDEKSKKLWGFSEDGINYIASSKLSGEKKINKVPFPVNIRKDVKGYENITLVNDEQYLLGSKTGYTILDLNELVENQHEIKINQVALNRVKDMDSTSLVSLKGPPLFDSAENNLQFSYSISEFLKNEQPMYRYKLEGMYDTWSNWTNKGSASFENLPYGDYTFLVEGKVGNHPTSNSASYAFRIDRPWFLSYTAFVLYGIVFLLFSLFMHNIYKSHYRKQRERLMQKTTRELELKELENKQQLMRFRNERLREDIEGKNRELGIATMNLIKKNEFLSSIKQELEGADSSRGVKQVVKIIDRNLNNNDDWNVFQEAFNNADKDFLKKVKSLHPVLTSNDLRLCAYLRLNLSSKEIAPLLNISPRSVEVKRYRLRKKMELPHESSLTDYILEI